MHPHTSPRRRHTQHHLQFHAFTLERRISNLSMACKWESQHCYAVWCWLGLGGGSSQINGGACGRAAPELLRPLTALSSTTIANPPAAKANNMVPIRYTVPGCRIMTGLWSEQSLELRGNKLCQLLSHNPAASPGHSFRAV